MLTHKQRWRRVRQTSRKPASLATSDVSPVDAATGGGSSNSMKSLSIGDSLLQLLGVKARSCTEEGIPSKDVKGIRGGAYSPVGGVMLVGTYSIGKVSFNQRVRVVLIPTRPELASIKADIWWEDQDYANFRREYIIFVRATSAPAAESPTTLSLLPSSSPPPQEHTGATSQAYNAEGKVESPSERVMATVGVDKKDDGESFSCPAGLPLPQLSLNDSGEDASIMLEDVSNCRSPISRGVVIDDFTAAPTSFTAGDCDTAAAETAAASASAIQPSSTQNQQQCHPTAGVTALGVLTCCGVTISGCVFVEGNGAAGAGVPEEQASGVQDVEELKDKEAKQTKMVMLSGRLPLSPHRALLPSTTILTSAVHVPTGSNDACGGGVTSRSQSLISISGQTDSESFSGGSDCDEDRDDAVVGRDCSCAQEL